MTPLDEFASEVDPFWSQDALTVVRTESGDWQIQLEGAPAVLVYAELFGDEAPRMAHLLVSILRKCVTAS